MYFSEEALHILHAGGWTEDRLLPQGCFIEKLTTAGYTPHPAALEVLQRFCGLELSYSDTDGNKRSLHFDIDRTISVCDIEDIEDYGNCIGTTLCPVGVYGDNYALIAVAEDQRVFSYFNPTTALHGYNYLEAIERLCTQPANVIKKLVYDGNPLEF